jgi:Uma2 family endonuclease
VKLAVSREEQMNTSVAVENEIEVEPLRRRFTVEEFQRMGEAGIFAPDERLELIDGEVIEMTPAGPRHVMSVFAVDDFLRSRVGPEIQVAVQNILPLPDSKPWPDLALLRKADFVPDRVPGAEACVLVVEVSDSTVLLDRNAKRRAYARAGIPEYWVVDLTRDALVQHLRPASGDYREILEHPRARRFPSPALGGREVRVDDLVR